MIHGFTDTQVIVALARFIVASYLASFGWLVTSLSDLRSDLHGLNRETRARAPGPTYHAALKSHGPADAPTRE
jgi:hypothetical protein